MLSVLSNPLIITTHASGRVKEYQIVVGGISLLTLPLVYIAFMFNAAPYYAMIIVFIVEFLCHIARIYMLTRIMDFPMWGFLKDVTFRLIIVTLLALSMAYTCHNFIDLVYVRFIMDCIVSMLSVVVIGFYIGFCKQDRIMIKQKVTYFVNRKFKKHNEYIQYT